ncbi:hypothetical protein [Campylobacter troglodytis]|uniref:hypothetical protein n=1 Tax=Campylobacter troglodytis TaxID=654363 RepID=UPI0011597283|nr:hypothetical protein [Campylobacter troglodytis]TQR61339.1 hypothetical protein DMC01_01850 [Campylobacter troglodytis]
MTRTIRFIKEPLQSFLTESKKHLKCQKFKCLRYVEFILNLAHLNLKQRVFKLNPVKNKEQFANFAKSKRDFEIFFT